MSIENLIFQIEESKGENNYAKARLIALDALKAYTDYYRLYEELADIYLFE